MRKVNSLSQFEFKAFNLKNPIPNALFEDFYAITEASFPKEERRTKEEFLRLAQFSEKYKIYSLLDGEHLVAFLTVWQFESFMFIDHFAVSATLRNKGIGAEFLKTVLSQSRLPFILEAELPETEIATRRLNFYKRNGFKENPFPYLLPPMQEGCEATAMHVLSYPKLLTESEFKNIKEILYREVYNAKTAAM